MGSTDLYSNQFLTFDLFHAEAHRLFQNHFDTFFLAYSLSSFTPLWWGPYCIPQSLLIFLGLFMYSLQLLRRKLSLIADSTSIGCRVGWVELHSKIYERK